MSSEAETIYERVAKLEDEIALLRSELDIIKGAFRNKIARHEISLIKEGKDIDTLINFLSLYF
jgi:cell division protein FtsB